MLKSSNIIRKYVFRSFSWMTFSIGFLVYSNLKHAEVEKQLFDKYLGNVSYWGLEKLADGQPLT